VPARFDAIVVGAGAAGLFCAARAGQLGVRVLLLDHAEKVAEKIRISGGGRCNFTNIDTAPSNFDSTNPDYCRSALARYTPRDFIALVERHGIGWHEKHKGQLFCDDSSARIVAMLLAECAAGGVAHWQPCGVTAVSQGAGGFHLETTRGPVQATRLVVATGGLSIPKIGASDWGYTLARQFGHAVVETRPALVPLTLAAADRSRFGRLAGVSLPVSVAAGNGKGHARFDEDLLFTHRGLSGPAILQASNYWRPGSALHLDCVPGVDLAAQLRATKGSSRRQFASVLGDHLPRRFVDVWLLGARMGLAERPLSEIRDRDLMALATALQHWQLTPDGTEGYRKAEVTAGGVDTRELESHTFESRRRRGLHFIGEVVDVTGWLGGYNFQWAWASAAACGRALRLAAARGQP